MEIHLLAYLAVQEKMNFLSPTNLKIGRHYLAQTNTANDRSQTTNIHDDERVKPCHFMYSTYPVLFNIFLNFKHALPPSIVNFSLFINENI